VFELIGGMASRGARVASYDYLLKSSRREGPLMTALTLEIGRCSAYN